MRLRGAVVRGRVDLPPSPGARAAKATDGPRPPGLAEVLDFVRRTRRFDASGYCQSVFGRRVEDRIAAAGTAGYGDYLRLLEEAPGELDLLVEALTIKVSGFFRDPLVFECLGEVVLPVLLAAKAEAADPVLRIWSAGCASGEEPYSVAILLHDLARRARRPVDATVFATDVDENALTRGREARYSRESVANVRLGLLESSFEKEGELYRVIPTIAETARFSFHDLAEPGSAAPAESVFGSFDLVLCRNVLIYFEADLQERVFDRLCRSVAPGGYLLLGPAESLSGPWAGRLRRVRDCVGLYQKPFRIARAHRGSAS